MFLYSVKKKDFNVQENLSITEGELEEMDDEDADIAEELDPGAELHQIE